MASTQRPKASRDSNGVVVYWRPGCGFCSALFRQLDKAGVAHERVDIWASDDARAFVRSVARGNETVPTVTVGSRALVNPSVHDILAAAVTEAPEVVPAGYEPPQPNRLARRLTRLLGG